MEAPKPLTPDHFMDLLLADCEKAEAAFKVAKAQNDDATARLYNEITRRTAARNA